MITKPSAPFHAALNSDESPLAPWSIEPGDFPQVGSEVDRWKFLLRYAVLAPSSHNTQPWLFRLRGSVAELYADRTRACRIADGNDRELIMSCGCALYHLRSAMAYFGYSDSVEIFPESNDPDLLARITLDTGKSASPTGNLMFFAIVKRRTNRQPFRNDPVPPALLAELVTAAQDEKAALQIIAGEEARYVAASLIAEGDRRQWAPGD